MNLYPHKNHITKAELAAAGRVAAYVRKRTKNYLGDIFGPQRPEIESRRKTEGCFIEFYPVFFTQLTGKFERNLVTAIRRFAAGHLTAEELKNAADQFIDAHTVIWKKGVPTWKVLEMICRT